jgi:hypothetical protein
MDGRTGALHVFDSAGRFHHVCPCTSKDFSGLVSAPSISFGDQGDVYFGPGKEIAFLNQKCPYAYFAPNGERLKSAIWPSDACWLQPGTNHLLTLGFRVDALCDLAGKTVRALPRRPDHGWLTGLQSAAIAPTGSFAILANQYEQGPPTVNVFKANGDPACTIPLPGLTRWSIEIDYRGSRIIVASQEGLFLFERTGRALYRCGCPLPRRPNLSYCPCLLDEGRTLAFVDGTNSVLYRYSLP